MRFLCVCIASLTGLLAVRCFVTISPEPEKVAANILRAVLANDWEWQIILTQTLRTEVVDFDGMLAELDLTATPGTGITANKIIQRLVNDKGTMGTQFLYGVRVLGVALHNQFMKSLLVHSYLASEYTKLKDTRPVSMRVCISKIQVSLVEFASKTAFFGHPIDFFGELNDEINAFFDANKVLLNETKKCNQKNRDIVIQFLSKLITNISQNIIQASQEHDVINYDQIHDMTALIKLNRVEEGTVVDQMKKIDARLLYAMTIKIDSYEHVNVSSIRLDVGEKRLNIHRYTSQNDEDELQT